LGLFAKCRLNNFDKRVTKIIIIFNNLLYVKKKNLEMLTEFLEKDTLKTLNESRNK
jgi:hypothetical protein